MPSLYALHRAMTRPDRATGASLDVEALADDVDDAGAREHFAWAARFARDGLEPGWTVAFLLVEYPEVGRSRWLDVARVGEGPDLASYDLPFVVFYQNAMSKSGREARSFATLAEAHEQAFAHRPWNNTDYALGVRTDDPRELALPGSGGMRAVRLTRWH